MAKLPFTKLGLKPNQEVYTFTHNELTIEVKAFLPIAEKLELISNVINLSHEPGENYSNPIKVHIYTCIEIIKYYTNITFTEKQEADICKLYDLLFQNGIIAAVINAIDTNEYTDLIQAIYDSIESIYKYQNSVLGVLDTISTDYSNLDLDASNIQKKLADPQNMELLKNVLTKLG